MSQTVRPTAQSNVQATGEATHQATSAAGSRDRYAVVGNPDRP